MVAFALNHMVAPRLGLDAFLALAGKVGAAAVELRNDLDGVPLKDGTPPDAMRAALSAAGARVLSVNALQRFNEWTPARAEEARALAAAAGDVGAEALVLCPVNEAGFFADDAARLAALREALAGLAPILSEAGLVGLVEPLGFAECTLRLKREAVDAIDAVGEAGRFRLVHDTFHHHVAGETEIFAGRTGLVHVSGVEDEGVPRETMRDPHRVLVGPRDRLDNVGQIRALRAGGYDGPLSFEPFAAEVAASPDIAGALKESMDFIAAGVDAAA